MSFNVICLFMCNEVCNEIMLMDQSSLSAYCSGVSDFLYYKQYCIVHVNKLCVHPWLCLKQIPRSTLIGPKGRVRFNTHHWSPPWKVVPLYTPINSVKEACLLINPHPGVPWIEKPPVLAACYPSHSQQCLDGLGKWTKWLHSKDGLYLFLHSVHSCIHPVNMCSVLEM